jgi:hypothetical protein
MGYCMSGWRLTSPRASSAGLRGLKSMVKLILQGILDLEAILRDPTGLPSTTAR